MGALTAVDTSNRAKLAALHMCVLAGATLVATFLEVGLFKWSGVLPVTQAVRLNACQRCSALADQTLRCTRTAYRKARYRGACLGLQKSRKHACKGMVCTKLHPC